MTAVAPRGNTAGARTRTQQWFAGVLRDPAVRLAAGLVVGLRVLLGVLAALLVRLRPPAHGGLAGALPAPHGLVSTYLIAPWERFDAFDFQRIATIGYVPGQQEQHYFPLLPALEHVLGAVTGGSLGAAGLLVSTVSFFVALVLLHRLAAEWGAGVSRWTVLFVAFGPAASFFLAPYTEALFLALSVGAVLAARRGRFALAGVLATLATLTRPQGILVAVPVAVEVMVAAVRARRERRQLPWTGAAVLLAPALLAGFFLYTKAVSGLTPLQAEQLQEIRIAPPWAGLLQTLHGIASHPLALVNGGIVVACAIGVVVMLVHRPRLPLSFIAYAAASVIVMASRQSAFAGSANPLVASDRFAVVIFPLFVLLAVLTRDRPRLRASLLVVFGALMLARFAIYVTNVFAA